MEASIGKVKGGNPTATLTLDTLPAEKTLLPHHDTNLRQSDAVAVASGSSSLAVAGTSHNRGKELLLELGTEGEKRAIIVNMAKARGAMRGRFLAVGVFVCILLISTNSLIDYMRKIWRMRGHLDINQLANRRFVLEFSEEGDFNHVTKGGPWRYKEDPVLVDVLKEGVDPETVQFLSVPIWVQFRKIPFYLLSKQLARDLGNITGELIHIDNNARGDICDKYIRSRIRLPLDRALQRWIPLSDEIADDEVVVYFHYERLPKFCLYCGFIGHSVDECSPPSNQRRKGYGEDLCVAPTHPDDPRCWFLPAITGQVRHQQPLPWRLPHPGPSKPTPLWVNTIIAHAASEVGKLMVHDHPDQSGDANKNPTDTDNQQELSSPPKSSENFQIIINNEAATDTDAVAAKKGRFVWRRITRDEKEVQSETKQRCQPRATPWGLRARDHRWMRRTATWSQLPRRSTSWSPPWRCAWGRKTGKN